MSENEMQMQTEELKLIKIALIGNGGVGKSALRLVYSGKEYDDQEMTIGFDFSTKVVYFDENKFRLIIWDCAGQSQFRMFMKEALVGSRGVILCFDVTRRHSFTNLKYWIEDIKKTSSNIEILLAGIKIDLGYHPMLNYEICQKYAKDNGLLGYFEVSPKNYYQIDRPFEEMLTAIKKNEMELENYVQEKKNYEIEQLRRQIQDMRVYARNIDNYAQKRKFQKNIAIYERRIKEMEST